MAGAVLDFEEEISELYKKGGMKAIESVPGVGVSIAEKLGDAGEDKFSSSAVRRTLRSSFWSGVAVGKATPSARGNGVDGTLSMPCPRLNENSWSEESCDDGQLHAGKEYVVLVP